MTSNRFGALTCRQQRSSGGIARRRSGTGLRRLAVAAAAVLTLTVSAEPIRLAGAADTPPTGSGKFLDHHGPVLHAVHLHLIYWGPAWTNTRVGGPRAEQITTAAHTMLTGGYMSGLAQYRGIGRGLVSGSTVIDTPNPPTGFTDKQIGEFLDRQLDAGTVPEPDSDNQTLYAVVLPAGFRSSGNSGFDGEHNYYTRHGRRIHYLWTAMSDTLPGATWILSHEVIEAATDPEGSGFRGRAGACDQVGWCEIADVCSDSTELDGVTVTSYWSNHTGGCLLPGRGRLGSKLPSALTLRRGPAINSLSRRDRGQLRRPDLNALGRGADHPV